MFRVAGCALLSSLLFGVASAEAQGGQPLANFVSAIKTCRGTSVRVAVLDFRPQDRQYLLQQERDGVRQAMMDSLSGISAYDQDRDILDWIRENRDERLLSSILGPYEVAIVFQYIKRTESSNSVIWVAQSYGHAQCQFRSTEQSIPGRTTKDPIPIENRFDIAADRVYAHSNPQIKSITVRSFEKADENLECDRDPSRLLSESVRHRGSPEKRAANALRDPVAITSDVRNSPGHAIAEGKYGLKMNGRLWVRFEITAAGDKIDEDDVLITGLQCNLKAASVVRDDRVPVPAKPPIRRPDPGAEAGEENTGARFVAHKSRDLEGGDFCQLKQVDQTACADACSSNSRCLAYSFDKWNYVCFLKSGIAGLFLRGDAQSDTGIRRGVAAPRQLQSEWALVWRRKYVGKGFPGTPYKVQSGVTFEGCRRNCLHDVACLAVTHWTNGGSCRFFDAPLEYSTVDPEPGSLSSIVNSAVKRQDLPRRGGQRAEEIPLCGTLSSVR